MKKLHAHWILRGADDFKSLLTEREGGRCARTNFGINNRLLNTPQAVSERHIDWLLRGAAVLTNKMQADLGFVWNHSREKSGPRYTTEKLG